MNPNPMFLSDNSGAAHPKIIEKITEANVGYMRPYGYDPVSEKAIEMFKNVFGQEIDVYMTLTGTAANIISLATVLRSFDSVLCAETAHINVDECGAPEKFTSNKIVSFKTEDGKLSPEIIAPELNHVDFEHHSQPRVVSISQATESGTLYEVDEIKRLCDFCHKNNLYVHMDGSRLGNASAALGVGLKEMTADAGVDILSFGGTKNGLACAEAVVFFDKELSVNTKYIRKQAMQLFSKMRYIAAQFVGYFEDDLWLKNAENANKTAGYLAEKLAEFNFINITNNVRTNAVFAVMPRNLVEEIHKEYIFYVWDEEKDEVRLMTSFMATFDEMDDFVKCVGDCALRLGLM